jgi:hypothetical protein
MNEKLTPAEGNSHKPLPILFAWCSTFAPFAVALVVFLVVRAADALPRDAYRNVAGIAYGCELFVLFCTFVLGLTSLFGIRQYGAHRILVPAVIGMLASGGLGFMAFVFWVMNGMGHM